MSEDDLCTGGVATFNGNSMLGLHHSIVNCYCVSIMCNLGQVNNLLQFPQLLV